MDWFKIFGNVVAVLFFLDFVINFSWYKAQPAFGGLDKEYPFKSIWHQRYNRFTNYVLAVVIVVALVRSFFF